MTKARDISKLLSTANGKIAGASLDVSFENISDSGTAGTKVASGTTGQRGSTAGQIRFNTTTGLAEYYTGTEFKVIDAPPTVTAVSPLEVDSQAGGNITFTITGSNFGSGAVTKFIGNDATEITASTTTVNSSSSISAIIARSSFVNAKEPYDVKVINASTLSATLDNQINVDSSPIWSTASGNIANIYDDINTTHATVSATDADGDTVSYSETGGTVLTTAGLTLNSSTGAISGDPTDVASSTTYNFNLRATANSKTVDRAFNIIVNKTLLNNVNFFNDSSGLALYRFENNTNDVSGNYNGTGYNSVGYSTGRFGNCYYNSNNSQTYIQISHANLWSYNTSWSVWIKCNGITEGTIFANLGDPNADLNMNIAENGRVNVSIVGGSSIQSTTTVNNNNWHQIVGCYSTSILKVYVNGQLEGTLNNPTISGRSYSVPMTIGNTSSTGSSTMNGAFYGFIDQLRVFNKILSNAEVTNLYNFESSR
jgi:hypothetical protein